MLPIIEKVLHWNESYGVCKQQNQPLAIVIAPSHELADQIEAVAIDAAAGLDVKVKVF